ncbi:MAG: hypothetical protein K6F16_06690 [Lachnospiraceae bacterium]|jgi:hypothetical protein|nr:hypothetical protein [Lachnospiraceae bacterium]
MEVADIEKLARKNIKILQRLSEDYRGVVIDTVNKAFGRNYSITDELEILSYNSLAIRADRERVYECKVTRTWSGELALCLIERGHAGGTGKAMLECNELFIDMGSLALIRTRNSGINSDRMRCIIDTPGGAIKFAIPIVEVDYERGQIMKMIKIWAE